MVTRTPHRPSKASVKSGTGGPKSSSRPKRSPGATSVLYDCAVVGGGMVGGVLAIALARSGLSVVQIDRNKPDSLTDVVYDGRASTIAFSSKRLLEALGIWEHLAPFAQPIFDIRVTDAGAPLFLHYDHSELGEPYEGAPFGWILENRMLRHGLAVTREQQGLVTIQAPATVTEVEAATGFSEITLDVGPALRAKVVLGADGADSGLRRRAGIRALQWNYPQTGIVCTMGHELPHNGVAHELFLPSGPFAVLPMVDDAEGRHRSSIVWTEKKALAAAMLALDEDEFALELWRRFGDWYGDVTLEGGRWSYPLRLLHAETYIRPRLALVGDAAHTIHPIAGQGLNLGLRDVAALSETLVDAHRLGLDIGSETVLARYERWRRFDTVALLAVTDGLNRLFSNNIAPVRWARRFGMATVNRMPRTKRFFMKHAMGTVGELPKLMRGEPL